MRGLYYVAVSDCVTVDQAITKLFLSEFNCNNPIGCLRLFLAGITECRKTHIAVTSSRSCDETFLSLLTAARVISS